MADRFLVQTLGEIFPAVPVLSEEGHAIPFEDRQQWSVYWLVDPLDGTQEFLNQSGEFSVNIALVCDGEPILGVLGLPVKDKVYVGAIGSGAGCWDEGNYRQLPPMVSPAVPPVLAVSRRNGREAAQTLAHSLGTAAPWCQLGGAIKFCEMAEGRAHIYPRFSPVCEWDVAAGHALIASLGGEVYQTINEPLRYNQQSNLQEVYFCACAPGLAERTLPAWLDIRARGN
jgi:3'(2'), 5'-bisphosphate nucleotidase